MKPVGERIILRDIEDELRESYLNYSMSVIVNRALPDVRDGLKPSIRRILYAMHQLGLTHDKPTVKCATIVGEVMGKYHPHGDEPIYGTLVRMAQDFSMRYMLVDGQGNFGSIDGDPPGAMRYTEARMSAIAEEMLVDINKNAVDFRPNFDERLQEPVVLPARLPNLLVNGSSGIAVAMATNIPPHNLREIVDAAVLLLEDPEASIEELMKFVMGPDFPTGGIIVGTRGIREAYLTGRGSIVMRARATIEHGKGGKESIVITEIPYQVNKTRLKEQIIELVRSKVITGIADLRDESDKDGIRVVIELKKDEMAQIVLNQLYKHTSMQSTFGVNMLALVNNQPKLLNLKQLLQHYLEHRKEVILRRTQFDLEKAVKRAHILEGLRIALRNLDEVVKIIRSSSTGAQARSELKSKFGLSDAQVEAILEMTLQRLTGMERKKVDDEYAEILVNIQELRSILTSEERVREIIKRELLELKEKYGDDRRTEIVEEEQELTIEDLIADEDMVVMITHAGYIKRMPLSVYRRQRRGGVGIKGIETKEEDFVESVVIASALSYILFFTDAGKCYWLKVFEIPEEGRLARGKAIVNLLNIAPGEKITTFVPVKEFSDDKYLLFLTKNGIIKKVSLEEFSRPISRGIIAVGLREEDRLVDVRLTDGKQDVIIVTRKGMSIRFPEEEIRSVGRQAVGVKAIRLMGDDEVVGMALADDNRTLLVVTEKGYGKRTPISEYRRQSRGGKGIIAIKAGLKNGYVVGVRSVIDSDELILTTTGGMVIRLPMEGIRPTGRATQGVRLIALQEGDLVSDIAKIGSSEIDDLATQGDKDTDLE